MSRPQELLKEWPLLSCDDLSFAEAIVFDHQNPDQDYGRPASSISLWERKIPVSRPPFKSWPTNAQTAD